MLVSGAPVSAFPVSASPVVAATPFDASLIAAMGNCTPGAQRRFRPPFFIQARPIERMEVFTGAVVLDESQLASFQVTSRVPLPARRVRPLPIGPTEVITGALFFDEFPSFNVTSRVPLPARRVQPLPIERMEVFTGAGFFFEEMPCFQVTSRVPLPARRVRPLPGGPTEVITCAVFFDDGMTPVFQPLSVPTRRRPNYAWQQPIDHVEDPFAKLSPEATSVDKFDGLWADPFFARRRRPLVHAIYGAALTETTLIPEAGEGATIRPWYSEFSQPVRLPLHRRAPARFAPMTEPVLDEASRAENTFLEWLVPMGLPARLLRKRVTGHHYPASTLEMDAAARGEQIFADKWFTQLSRPTLPAQRIRPGAVTMGRLDLDPIAQLETISLDKFYSPLSLPTYRKPMPRRPWTIAFEEYDESGFQIPLALRLHREMYAGGY